MKKLFLLLALCSMVAVGCTEGGGELDENGNGGNGGVTLVKNNIIEYTTTDALPLGPYNQLLTKQTLIIITLIMISSYKVNSFYTLFLIIFIQPI